MSFTIELRDLGTLLEQLKVTSTFPPERRKSVERGGYRGYSERPIIIGYERLANPFEDIYVDLYSDTECWGAEVWLLLSGEDEDEEQTKPSQLLQKLMANEAVQLGLQQYGKLRVGREEMFTLDGRTPRAIEVVTMSYHRRRYLLILFARRGVDSWDVQCELTNEEALASDLQRLAGVVQVIVGGLLEETTDEIVLRLAPTMKEEDLFLQRVLLQHDEGHFTPDELRSLIARIQVDRPTTTFTDVGGQREAKDELRAIATMLKAPDVYRRWGTTLPKGILLYGPPGTGKTLLARALANEAGVRFFNVQMSDFLSKWYGETELLLDAIFAVARTAGRCIIFFDELDAISPERSSSAATAEQTNARVVSALLVNLDGFEASGEVLLVGATNRADAIDPALLRPGRIDRVIEVALPDQEGRREVLRVHLRLAAERAGRELCAPEATFDRFLQRTEGLSGADIRELLRRALEAKARSEIEGGSPTVLIEDDLLREIERYERAKERRRRIGF